MAKKRATAPVAPVAAKAEPPPLDRAKLRDTLLAKSIVNLQDKLRRGETLKAHEFKTLDAFLDGHGPGSLEEARRAPSPAAVPAQANDPPDVSFKTVTAGCELMGIHKNSASNWNKAGMRPPGDPPFSLKAWCLILRRGGKLGECKPATTKSLAVWRWAFKAGSEEALDPDDPVHDPPANWKEEQARQAALRERDQRRDLRIDIETKERERLKADEVGEALKQLARDLSANMAHMLRVANEMQDQLTPKQVADLGDRLQQAITDVKAKHAESAVAVVEALLRG